MIEYVAPRAQPQVPPTNEARYAAWLKVFTLYVRCLHANHTIN